MAAAIGGTTLHAGADLPRPGQSDASRLAHSDVDHLHVRSANVPWLLCDEISMVADTLMGAFESHIRSASRKSRYSKRRDKSERIFGGYNFLAFLEIGTNFRLFLIQRPCSIRQVNERTQAPK